MVTFRSWVNSLTRSERKNTAPLSTYYHQFLAMVFSAYLGSDISDPDLQFFCSDKGRAQGITHYEHPFMFFMITVTLIQVSACGGMACSSNWTRPYEGNQDIVLPKQKTGQTFLSHQGTLLAWTSKPEPER